MLHFVHSGDDRVLQQVSGGCLLVAPSNAFIRYAYIEIGKPPWEDSPIKAHHSSSTLWKALSLRREGHLEAVP